MQLDNSKITDEGKKLLTLCQAEGKSLVITKIQAGKGSYSDQEEIHTKRALKEYVQDFTNVTSHSQENTTIIRGTLSNVGLKESYKVKEIGIFAKQKGDDSSEILYAISVKYNDSDADVIPIITSDQPLPTYLYFTNYLPISHDVKVELTVNTDVISDRIYLEFEALKADITNHSKEWIDKLKNSFEAFGIKKDELIKEFTEIINNANTLVNSKEAKLVQWLTDFKAEWTEEKKEFYKEARLEKANLFKEIRNQYITDLREFKLKVSHELNKLIAAKIDEHILEKKTEFLENGDIKETVNVNNVIYTKLTVFADDGKIRERYKINDEDFKKSEKITVFNEDNIIERWEEQ